MITLTAPPKRDRTSPVDLTEHARYVDTLMQEAIKHKLFPGCSYGAFYYGGPYHFWQYQKSYGAHTYEATAMKLSGETFFDVASVTKVLPTSLLLLHLIDEGVICADTFDEPIQRYLPEFRGPGADTVTIRHILSFAIKLNAELGKGTGAYRVKSLLALGAEGIHQRIMSSGLSRPPGLFAYHNSTSYIAARLIEKLYSMTYEQAARKFVLGPLGITGGFFCEGDVMLEKIAPTEIQDGETIHGVPHDEFSRALEMLGGPKSGSAGLFLSANDGMKILRAFCDPNGKSVYRSPGHKMVIRTPGRFGGLGLSGQMRTNQLSDPEHIYGLGWDILDRSYGDCACGPESTMLITGFTGCVIMLQPTRHRGFFLFANATYPKRHALVDGRNALYELRRSIFLSLQSCKCDD